MRRGLEDALQTTAREVHSLNPGRDGMKKMNSFSSPLKDGWNFFKPAEGWKRTYGGPWIELAEGRKMDQGDRGKRMVACFNYIIV